ncbi:MAG: ferrous iron transport protein A [Candidatus Eremiobacteraeota bacterium]|nr:ferrous iron transport protein A [Candidatus Eremiobacteraeota bacterium]
MSKTYSLAQIKSGTLCKVIKIHGGKRANLRLEALGIRPGVKLIKRSQLIGHGPVTVEINSHQVALGYAIAHKVIVETIK